jgi:hypothetical protein
MFYLIKAFFFISLIAVLFCIGIIILGEYLTDKFSNSKFAKWWRKKVISEMPDDYEK